MNKRWVKKNKQVVFHEEPESFDSVDIIWELIQGENTEWLSWAKWRDMNISGEST